MEEVKVTLQKYGNIRFNVYQQNGEPTGEYIDIDVDDKNLPFKMQNILDESKKAHAEYKRNKIIAEKKQDVKAKNEFMTQREKALIKVENEYIEKQRQIFNMFLGENGVEKLLYGRPIGILTMAEIDELIMTQMYPQIEKAMGKMKDRADELVKKTKEVKEKYKDTLENEDVIE